MKHIKKIFVFLTASFILMFSGIQNVYAADSACKVYDLNDSLTDVEEKVLNKKISKQADKLNFNIAVVITDDLGPDSKGYLSYYQEETVAQDFADDYYDELFGAYTDGILLLIDDELQCDSVSTSGSLIDEYQKYIYDGFLDDVQTKLRSGNYYGAVDIFVSRVDLKVYKFADAFSPFLTGAAIALVASLITCLIIARSYKTHKKYQSKNYNSENQLNFREKSDSFIREYTTKTKIESSSGGSRSGGGGYHGSSSHHGGGSRHR